MHVHSESLFSHSMRLFERRIRRVLQDLPTSAGELNVKASALLQVALPCCSRLSAMKDVMLNKKRRGGEVTTCVTFIIFWRRVFIAFWRTRGRIRKRNMKHANTVRGPVIANWPHFAGATLKTRSSAFCAPR
jgi:hypothetical protein